MVNGDGSGHNQGTETKFRDSQNHSMAIVSEPDNLSGRPRSPMITSGHNWSRPWICGLGSGVCDILLTFPINKLMFRQQLNGYTATNAARSLIGTLCTTWKYFFSFSLCIFFDHLLIF